MLMIINRILSFGRCVNSDTRSDQCHVLETTELLKVSPRHAYFHGECELGWDKGWL